MHHKFVQIFSSFTLTTHLRSFLFVAKEEDANIVSAYRGFLQLFPISRCLFTPHFIWVRILCDRGRNDKKEQQQSYAAVLLSVADRIIIFAFYRIIGCALW